VINGLIPDQLKWIFNLKKSYLRTIWLCNAYEVFDDITLAGNETLEIDVTSSCYHVIVSNGVVYAGPELVD